MLPHTHSLSMCSYLKNLICLLSVFFALLSVPISVVAQSGPLPPAEVSAILYSNSAVELFWSPGNNQVEIIRNNQALGRFDSRSLFQSNLDSSENYRFELRSVNDAGELSSPVVLHFTLQDYEQPYELILPSEQNDTSTSDDIEEPSGVKVLLYSQSAAELFWLRPHYMIDVVKNGEWLGRFDSTSLFQPNLDASQTYRYELRAVNSLGEVSPPVVISFSPQTFSQQVTEILPNEQANASTSISVVEFLPEVTQGVVPLAVDIIEPEPVKSEAVRSEPVKSEPVKSELVELELVDAEVAEKNDFDSLPETVQEVIDDAHEDSSQSVIEQTSSNCIAGDITSLRACVSNIRAYQKIDLANDITCGSNCCSGGNALLRLNNVHNLEIQGHGHRLLRTDGQRQCSLLDINHSSNIHIESLHLDDDSRVGGCHVSDNCPRMVHIRASADIRFEDAHVSHGKGYAFYVQGTDGFQFHRGSLHNSGVLGMYIGHESDASSDVQITESTFSDNQTNGLALLGLTGPSITTNRVTDNIFARNHRRGQWPVAPSFGTGLTGGGQLYVARANNVTVRNNIVRDGYCDNCFVQSRNRSGVSGIELGRPNQQSLSNVDVSDNILLNLDGFGISQNANSSLTNNVNVRNNVILNSSRGEIVEGANESGNYIVDTQHFDSFEASNDIGGRFRGELHCSTGGAVSRVCGVESRFGQCVAQLSLGTAQCTDVRVLLEGPEVGVRAGQVAIASGWVRSPIGDWCVVFRDGSGNTLSEQCENLSNAGNSDVQAYVGIPTIQAIAPDGSATVSLKAQHSRVGSTMWLDDLKLSVGNAR